MNQTEQLVYGLIKSHRTVFAEFVTTYFRGHLGPSFDIWGILSTLVDKGYIAQKENARGVYYEVAT